jgi:hypothetical protein
VYKSQIPHYITFYIPLSVELSSATYYLTKLTGAEFGLESSALSLEILLG